MNSKSKPEDTQAPGRRRPSFSDEIFAELLTELPVHRHQISGAWEAGDMNTLRAIIHKLLGAVSYCDAPELEEALRELQRVLKTEERHSIKGCHERALNAIDNTLRSRG